MVGGERKFRIEQIAALPYRYEPDGSVRLLLITSRETRRWVVPKGNPIEGLEPHLAAAHEAYEEAGITGIACAHALGSYQYDKRRKSGAIARANVVVFPLAFTEQLPDWPEADQRDTKWFTQIEAVEAVDEPELKRLIAAFHPRAPRP